jgi:predicted lipoprotein
MSHIKTAALAALIALVGLGAAEAQTTPSSPSTTVPKSNDANAPVPGANSFTEAQAKDRMEKAGFTEVTGLKKDDQGIWRASAKQGDKVVTVTVDFRGNVVAQ